jgi:hypothetical protein
MDEPNKAPRAPKAPKALQAPRHYGPVSCPTRGPERVT